MNIKIFDMKMYNKKIYIYVFILLVLLVLFYCDNRKINKLKEENLELKNKKWIEINTNFVVEGGRQFNLMVQKMLNMPVEDAIGAANLAIVAGALLMGPGLDEEIIEKSRERAVIRITKCPLWEGYEEFEVEPEVRVGDDGHHAMFEAGLKAVNPKLTHRITKALEKGDPYCEVVIEFKDE